MYAKKYHSRVRSMRDMFGLVFSCGRSIKNSETRELEPRTNRFPGLWARICAKEIVYGIGIGKIGMVTFLGKYGQWALGFRRGSVAESVKKTRVGHAGK